MVADTEKEIFHEGIGEQEPDDHGQQMVDDLSQVEGFDGNDLPIEEIAHRNIYGDTPTNFDRPIEMQDQLALKQENDALRAQLDAVSGAYNQYVAAPQQEAQRAQYREQVRQHLSDRYGMFDSYDDAKLDQFINDHAAATQHAGALQVNRIEASMSHAHAKYGRDFEDAYHDLTSMDPNNPLARHIVHHVVGSADPGEKLLELHGNSLVQSLGPSTPPPFMPFSARPARTMRPPRPSDAMDAGWGNRETEEDVFNSAFDDEGWGY
jgi:hypothetical protein